MPNEDRSKWAQLRAENARKDAAGILRSLVPSGELGAW
jgi:hypothetical protein